MFSWLTCDTAIEINGSPAADLLPFVHPVRVKSAKNVAWISVLLIFSVSTS